MEINASIRGFAEYYLRVLEKLTDKNNYTIHLFDIDCSALEDYSLPDRRESENFKSLFDNLQNIKGPCVYFFDIDSNHEASEVIESIKKYASTEGSKTIPAIKQNYSTSKTLYVGKRKSRLDGRIFVHLGSYHVKGTQGLQLYYWAKDMGLKLKLTIVEFNPEMVDLISILEHDFALKLKPILGMHRT